MPLFVEIRTPENVILRQPLAGMASRAQAFAHDLLLQAIAIYGLVLLLSPFERTLGPSVSAALQTACGFLVIWGYHLFFELVFDGRTPGKRSVGIRVAGRSGQPVDFAASALRNLLRVVDLMPHGFVIGIIAMFATRDHQRIGDLAAGTVVVRDLVEDGGRSL